MKNSAVPNSIPTKIVKIIKKLISTLLSTLINNSFANGIFPNVSKIAKVVSVFKNAPVPGGIRTIAPEKITPRVELGFGLGLRLVLGLRGDFPQGK